MLILAVTLTTSFCVVAWLSICVMIWVRGTRADYDGWAYLGADGWAWDEVRPVYERIEHRSADDGGIVTILSSYQADAIQDSVVAAAQACGIPFNGDYNGDRQDGVSYMQFSIADRLRHSTAAAGRSSWS